MRVLDWSRSIVMMVRSRSARGARVPIYVLVNTRRVGHQNSNVMQLL